LAQVNSRNAISREKRIEYDVWYVNNLTFFSEVRIVVKTIINIINRKILAGVLSDPAA